LLLALTFLVVKGFEYNAKFNHHYYPSTNNFLGLYFTITGLHGLHVLGGIVVFLYFFVSREQNVEDRSRALNRQN